MKTKFFIYVSALLITGTMLFNSKTTFAQSPYKMSYQAVIRNSSNGLVAGKTVGMRISILQGSPNGSVVYTETQTTNTNANGLVSLEIGNGTGFSKIDWAKGPFYIKTETDPAGGTYYTITGTTQLLSVPFALHAQTADNISGITVETDPVYAASPAGTVTSTNITNWNSAYNWGNHATAGYLKNFTELDPIFGASPAKIITTTNIANWTVAYSWGNHAGLYKPVTYVPDWSEITANPFKITTPAAGQLLRYNLVSGKFENVAPDYYTKTDLQTSGGAQVHWKNITNTPTTLADYGITDAALATHNHTLDGLSNVKITTKADTNILQWDNASSKWVNRTLPEAGIQPAGNYLAGTIKLTGDITGSGTNNIATSLAKSGVYAGNYTQVTVNDKGLVTAGGNPSSLGEYGITDALSIYGGTMIGKLTTAAATASRAGLSLPHGTFPTAPVDGDIWTTTSGLYAQINGITVGLTGATGTVTNMTLNTNNGISGVLLTPNTTPNITLGLGNITPTSVVTAGDVTGNTLISTVTTGTAPFVVTSTTPVANLSIEGNAKTATNITGIVAIANGGTNAGTVVGAKTNLGLDNVNNTSDISKPVSTATQTALDLKEDLVNKSDNIALGNSVTLYPTQNAVKTYVDGTVAGATPDADATTKGKLKLAGDFAGTADVPAIAVGAVTSAKIADGTIVDADMSATAAIADTKLATIATAGKVSNSATTATSVNVNNTIVLRDGSGNFAAGTITGNLTGNVTGNTSGSAASFTGLLAGDVSGNQATTSVDKIKGVLVDPTAPTANQVLMFVGGKWVPSNNVATTNADLTGPISSSGNVTSITSKTGSGTTFVVDNSPTLITPTIGVATATSINKLAITAPATGATLTIAEGKTLTVPLDASVSGTNTGDNATNTTSNTYADSKVADAINDGVTTIAPSQNAVFDALALKSSTAHNHALDGLSDVTVSGKADKDLLQWDSGSSKWVNKTLAGAGIVITETDPVVKAINGLVKSNLTTISAATAGTDYSAGTSALGTGILKSTNLTGALSIAVPADFPILDQNTAGNAATATTAISFSGPLTGDVTGTQSATVIADNTISAPKLKGSLGALGNGVAAKEVLQSNGNGTFSWLDISTGIPMDPTNINLTIGSFLVGGAGNKAVVVAKNAIPISGFGAAAADVAMGGFKITGLADPSSAQDAATRNYVDNQITAAAHAPVTLGTANGLSLSTQALSLATATGGAAGAMSAADKTKLDGIDAGAKANTNLGQGTLTGTTVPLTSSTGTGTTLAAATGTNAGVMSAADKTKLDGIANNANNYTPPNHTGDVTSVGDGATTIANNAVTYAKMQQVGASSLLGNPTGAAAIASQITLGSGLSFSGTTLTATGLGGTVTSVSTAAANNGVSATWSMASPTPALTIGLGAITPTSVTATGDINGNKIIKTGGASTEFLKADGSVDTNTYLTSTSGVTSITGTANQITASSATGAVTLSLPAAVNVGTSVTSPSFIGTATNATNTGITEDAATSVSVYPTWVTANTGNLPQKVTSGKLNFIPSTGILTATGFSGSGAGLTNIPNSAFTNSSLTIGTTNIPLGTTTLTLGGLTSVTATNFLGNATTATTATNLANGASGSVPYQTGSGTTAMLAKGSDGQVFTLNAGIPSWATPTTGTVTSVGLSLPAIFTVTNSPVTGSGTLTGSLTSQAANTFFAAPNGSAGTPTFRAMVAADVPTLNQNTTGTAAGFTGSLGGDVTGTQSATVIAPGAVTSGKIDNNTILDVNVNTGAAIAGTKINPDFGAQTVTIGTAAGSAGKIVLHDAVAGPNTTTLQSNANVPASFTLTLPDNQGNSNQVLTTDGSGNLSWSSPAGIGTVTSIATGTGLTGGPITGSGTISLANMNAYSLMGNSTNSSGVPGPITLGSGLSWSGTALVATGSGGSVTDVSVVSANGVSGTVATSNTTPAITLTLGAITPSSVAATGTVTGSNLSGINTGDNAVNANSNAYADAKVSDAIVDGVTTVAPSQNAVFDALALKIGGNLPIGAGTNTKITYDAKGLVTAGSQAVLASADFANQGTTTTVLHGNASGNPTFSAINLVSDVTGNLDVAHLASGLGATNTTFWRGDGTWVTPAGTGVSTFSGGTTGLTPVGPVNGAITLGGTLAVANGGTGQTTYSNGELLIGNTTGNTLTKATLTGTANQVNVTNGNGSITLSLPQSIATTSTPTFASQTLTSNTNQFTMGTGVNKGTISMEPLTASRTWTFPDNTGIVALKSDIANQSITFTASGDVTGTATGTTSLLPNLTIASSAVTNAKMANMAAYSVKGNSTNTPAVPTDITAGDDQVLRRNGSGNLDFGTVNTAGISGKAVTITKMADLSGNSKLLGSAAGGVPVSEITLGSGVAMTGNVLSATGLGGTVTNIATGTGLTGGPITTTGTISMANMPLLSVKGNPLNAAGVPQDIATTAGSGLVLREAGNALSFGQVGTLGIANWAVTGSKINISGETNMGDMMYYDNGTFSWKILLAGAANNVLQSNGVTAPTWQPGVNIIGDISVTDAGVSTIQPSSVTYTKMQPLGGFNRLLGSGSTNTVQEITLGSGLSMNSSNILSSSAIATVNGTAPINANTVGTTTTISIIAASPGITGSMSGADKTKLDNINFTVQSFGGPGPWGWDVKNGFNARFPNPLSDNITITMSNLVPGTSGTLTVRNDASGGAHLINLLGYAGSNRIANNIYGGFADQLKTDLLSKVCIYRWYFDGFSVVWTGEIGLN